MSNHVVTLELPREVYKRARHVARTTRRSLEEVVVDWIHPPGEEDETTVELETLSTDKLVRVAQDTAPLTDSRRLQELLAIQRRRELTAGEQREAASLVQQEDRITLRKARALFLLKERGLSPGDLIPDAS
ncbi:MAG: hypothetical protein HY784_03625 [Chloroflexi bacterium]|nr:hypothetical protein [Chloroflexota bacterium]